MISLPFLEPKDNRGGWLTSEVLAEPLPSGAAGVAVLQQGHVLGPHMRRDDHPFHISLVQDWRLVKLQLMQQAAQDLLSSQRCPRADQGQSPEYPAEPRERHGAAQEEELRTCVPLRCPESLESAEGWCRRAL